MKTTIHFLGALAIAAGAGCAPAAQVEPAAAGGTGSAPTAELGPPLELGDYARVYRGDHGLRVTLVPIRGEPPRALVQLTGVDSKIDGQVHLAELLDHGNGRIAYVIAINGDKFAVLYNSQSYGRETFYARRPENYNERFPVSYDEEGSEAVDREALELEHRHQAATGIFERMAAFNRDERVAYHDEELGKEIGKMHQACGREIPTAIDWQAISDDLLKEVSPSGFCEPIVTRIARLCEDLPESREFLAARVKRIRCRFADEPAVDLRPDGTLLFSTARAAVNLDDKVWDLARTAFGLDRTVLRVKDGVYLLLDPGDADGHVYLGDGNVFYRHDRTGLNASHNIRYLWGAAEDAELRNRGGEWTLTCGKREKKLEVVPRPERSAILERARLEGPRWDRQPFVLARDDRGTYYYVDRLIEERGGKGFRVFTGPKGQATLSQLVNIVDDSKGMVFATRDGNLRLVINKNGHADRATWIRGRSRAELVTLPPQRNRRLVFEELGVYTGESLGSACEEI